MFEYAGVAQSLESPLAKCLPFLPHYVRVALDKMIELGDNAGAWRLERIATLETISASLTPLNDLMLADPLARPPPRPNIPCAVSTTPCPHGSLRRCMETAPSVASWPRLRRVYLLPPPERPIFASAEVPQQVLQRMHDISPREQPITALETMGMTDTYILGTNVWIEHVPGVSNLADLPSRPSDEGNIESILALGATRIPFEFPSLRSWSKW
jgi:hypothetical protein